MTESATPITDAREALEHVAVYIEALDAFYGSEPIEDTIDTADGSSDGARLSLSDLRTLVVLRQTTEAEPAPLSGNTIRMMRQKALFGGQVQRSEVADVAAELLTARGAIRSAIVSLRHEVSPHDVAEALEARFPQA